MATIPVDASLLIYHQELRILSSAFWFFSKKMMLTTLGEHFFECRQTIVLHNTAR